MSGDVHYFSNGTEGFAWMDEWCNRCANDHCTHNADPDYENACGIIRDLISHRANPAMVDFRRQTKYGELPDWKCMEFSRCSCDRGPDDSPGPEPEPPVHPDQCVLFDADALMPGVPRGALLDVLDPVPA